MSHCCSLVNFLRMEEGRATFCYHPGEPQAYCRDANDPGGMSSWVATWPRKLQEVKNRAEQREENTAEEKCGGGVHTLSAPPGHLVLQLRRISPYI